MPDVSVCIVTHNSADDLPLCLDALAAQMKVDLEVVLVDCASGDNTVEVARSRQADALPLTVVPLAENRGFAGGMNEAIAHSTAPLILSLNADALPEPSFVARLKERLEKPGDVPVGAVTGRLVRPPKADQPQLLDACGMYLLRSWRHLDRGSGEVDRGQYGETERVFGATGAATLYRRKALEDVAIEGEFFDSLFHSFREDAELSFRLRERGWEILYEPAARAIHRRFNLPSRRRQMPAAVNYHSLKNRYLLRIYHQTAGNFFATLVPTLARDLLALAYVLLVERSSLAAYRWLWQNRRRIRQRRRILQGRRTQTAAAVNRWFYRDGESL